MIGVVSTKRTSTSLDAKSKTIIELLQRDGRRSYAEIGKAVGLSEAAVRQRVQKLTDAGVMQIVAVTDPMRRAETALPEETCEDFNITSRDVRHFFRYAQAVNRSDYREYYLQTGCYGKGVVTYANGMRAEWLIESGGRGFLVPVNGKNKGVFYYLYCDDECENLGIDGPK